MFLMLQRIKRSGVMVCYHAGDARTEPRYVGDASSFLSMALVNHSMLDRFSDILKVPTYYWPYMCLYQKDIVDPDPRYAADVAFTGVLATDQGHVHQERTEFIYRLKTKLPVRVFPDKTTGNTSFQTAEVAASAKCVMDVQMRDKIPQYLSVRPFQYIGAGALFFHDDNDHINASFEEGRHYVGYKKCDVDSFIEKYDYYVNKHPEKGQRIRRQGFEYAQKYHSSKERVKFVIDLYEGRRPRYHLIDKSYKVFESAHLKRDTIEIDGAEYKVIKGKHSMYVPEKNMKIVWSHNGKIESYVDWEKGRNAEAIRNHAFNLSGTGYDEDSLQSIVNEYRIFEELASEGISPPVRGFFRIKNMISDAIYKTPHCDVRGCYGFFMDDANKIPSKGSFSLEAFRSRFVDTGRIKASEPAIGDLRKHDNVINGYLIDVRRSIFDMMTMEDKVFSGPFLEKLRYRENQRELADKVSRQGRFPKGEGDRPYQTCRINGTILEGVRDTTHRFEKMGIAKDLSGKTLLDLGCNIGAMSAEAYSRGARKITAVDIDEDYISCARDLARANGEDINYQRFDFTQTNELADYIARYYTGTVDIVFALSIYEFGGKKLWDLLDQIDWNICYVESHNSPQALESDHVRQMRVYLDNNTRFKTHYLGQTGDRSPRCVWRLERIRS